MKITRLAATISVALLLGGCGGGGGGAPPPVATAPSIAAQPRNATVVAGSPVTFNVTAAGTAPLTYQWKRGGTAVSGATAASFTLATTAAADDAASFTVDVNNSAGSVTSSAATLTVQVPPTLSAQPQSVSSASGQPVTLSVTAAGTAPLTYQWKANGTSIVGATGASLTIAPVSAHNNGVSYTVAVTNIAGTVASNAAVVHIVPPLEFVAGNSGGPGNLNGPLATARIGAAGGITVDNSGNTVVIDTQFNNIRQLSSTALTTLVGKGGAGSTDGAATAAQFNIGAFEQGGVAFDTSGNLYVADTNNQTIRKVTPAGVVSTLAGVVNTSGLADGAGALALFNRPQDLTVGFDGALYVADAGNNAIRRVTLAGVVTTIAGGTGSGATNGAGSVAKFSFPSGIISNCMSGACLIGPNNSWVLWVSDTGNNTIRTIAVAGAAGSQTYTVSTLAGTAGPAGTADGTGAAAHFGGPRGLAYDGSNVYVADTGNFTIRQLAGNVVTTLAGTAGQPGNVDSVGAAARFLRPVALTYNVFSGLAVSDLSTVRRVTVGPAVIDGVVSTLVGTLAGGGTADGTGSAAKFANPPGIAADAAGNLYVADSPHQQGTIRKITPAGVVSTLANVTYAFGVAVDSTGRVWSASGLGGLQTITPAGVVALFAGTTGADAAASFTAPTAVAVDSSDNIYVFDVCTVWKITPAKVVSALAGSATCGYLDGTGAAAQFTAFDPGLAVDGSGNIYVSDPLTAVIRKVTSAGVVTIFAGTANTSGFADGTGTAAQFNNPAGLAVDGAGSVYVADLNNSLVRKITSAGVVSTVVGTPGSAGVQVGALPGSLNGPQGIAVLPGSNLSLAITDSTENAVLTISFP
jgi:sugar lactone lactonase YvrE